MNKKIICSICGKEIKENETITVFNNGETEKTTHTMNDGYDCDYEYMLECCCPKLYSKEEYEGDEVE